jgi:glycine cleavage system T protein
MEPVFDEGTVAMPEKSPLYETAIQAGAVFVEAFGWLIPAHYGNAAAEYQNAREHAALFDISHQGKVEASGADAATFLHNLCTNEVKNLPAGAGAEAFLTTGQAKIVAFVVLYRTLLPQGPSVFHLDAGPGMGERVIQHLDRYLISEQVKLANRTHDFAQLHLAGPRAREVLEQALGGKMPNLVELQHATETLAGARCQLRCHQPLGLLGYDLLCEKERAVAVWQALIAGGARPAGLEALNTLRIEAGTPVYGTDIDDTNLPQEVARVERTISFTKGCYIGQETVARIRTYGHVNRSLLGLKLAGAGAVSPGAKLFRAGKEVGHITSSVVSPKLGQAIALAIVRRGSHEPGTILEVEEEGSRRSAEVVSLPFAGSA